MQSILVVQRVVRAAFSGIATLNGRRHLRSWRRQSATLLPTAGLSTTTQALEERTLLAAAFPQFLDPNPSVQNGFGEDVLPLSTGNVVITAPWDDAAGEDAGAVYLFNGSTGELISTLLGASPFDHIGSGGVVGLENGNFVISSPDWKNGGIAYAGAVTFSNGLTGISGVVSAANSMVGETFGDNVGGTEVVALANGNYVVVSKGWSSGGSANVGAVTFGNGLQGVSGPVSAANSLVGTSPGDLVGLDSVVSLPNGNYVVVSSAWNSGAAPEVGAVTFGNGVTGISGPVSSANSLVGKRALDRVGEDGVTVLSNGNYVVSSTSWDNGSAVDAGASTFGRGTVGITGEVSASNSLVGTRSDDLVGAYRTIALPNGNYLVSSPFWDNGGAADAGAVTFCNGTLGLTGAVSALNSLVGSTSGDSIGETDRIVLANGNYVICSASWDNGAAVDAGAATYGSGTTGVTGVVSALNSLVGTQPGDRVSGFGAVALRNGNYVVQSPWWSNGAAAEAGAVTFGNGTAGITGAVTTSNSLVGTTAGDNVGLYSVKALTNGNYVVGSPLWDNGSNENAGAATFGNGVTGIAGPVSTTNSLFGSAFDYVADGIEVLSNGNYVVKSPDWNNGAVASAGAATFGNGTTGTVGLVTSSNSLVGTQTEDFVGRSVHALANGNYVVASPAWDNETTANAGAATFGNGTTGVKGTVSGLNSLVGDAPNDRLGSNVVAFENGNYLVAADLQLSTFGQRHGAFTFGSGTTGVQGLPTALNTVFTDQPLGLYVSEQVVVNEFSGAFYVIENGDAYSLNYVKVGSQTTGVYKPLSSWFNDPNPRPENNFGAQILPLNNGNVVVTSPGDDAAGLDAGAVYLFNGATRNLISVLRGAAANDRAGSGGLFELESGNYLIASPYRNHGTLLSAGAVTFGSAVTGVSGSISSDNSLIGTSADDRLGENLLVLKGGNYIVQAPNWDNAAVPDAGAVVFGSGTTGVRGVVSASNSLIGTASNDRVGNAVQLLPNGNYLIQSPDWDSSNAGNVGAVTLGNAVTGVVGTITAANSLIGNASTDNVGSRVVVLRNGNYLVLSPEADSGAIADTGAVTFANGSTGITGTLSTQNSLFGSTAGDRIGYIDYIIEDVLDNVRELRNGNIVLISPDWDNGPAVNAGAATFIDGNVGRTGVISAANSLVGSHSNDRIGWNFSEFTELPNGNYVISAPYWDSPTAVDAGAVILCNGITGTSGTISETNSLIGATAGDRVGTTYFGSGIVVLKNGNYVVRSSYWNHGAAIAAGAATLCSGTTPTTGFVSAANSLVGSQSDDGVGFYVIPLANGNFVVRSPYWHGGGAITLCNGQTGLTGEVTAANSLLSGSPVEALTNGNYVVIDSNWNNFRGAVTFGNGVSGVAGAVTSENSLVGSAVGDQIGHHGIAPLANGNYVVKSPYWNDKRGAATFGDGTVGVTGGVSAQNSFVGFLANNFVGYDTLELANGNVLIISPYWDGIAGYQFDATKNGPGALTLMNGRTGGAGTVSASNSLVGTTPEDSIGAGVALFNDPFRYGGVFALPNGNYVVSSPGWDNGASVDAGAITFGDGQIGTVGVVSSSTSLVGNISSQFVGYKTAQSLGDSRFFCYAGFLADYGVVGDGSTGASGVISELNAFVVNGEGLPLGNVRTPILLSNGNYLIPYSTGVIFGSKSRPPIGVIDHRSSLYSLGSYPVMNELVVADDGKIYASFNDGIFIGTIEDGFLPRINTIPGLAIKEDASEQTINLSGIVAGWGQGRPMQITATSSNVDLIANPTVNYTSPNSTGSLKLRPAAFRSGVATITLTLEDGGPDGNLATSDDNSVTTRSFTVSVQAIRPTLVGPAGNIVVQRPKLEWTAVPDAAKYEVWIKNSTTGLNPFHKGETASTFYQMPVDLGVGKMDVWVRAVLGNGVALPWSQLHRFTVITAPTLAPLDNRQTTSRPSVSWNSLYGASSWDIWVNNLTAGGTLAVRTTSATASWTPASDLPMARFRIWVRALGTGGFAGAWSSGRDFYVASAPLPQTPVQPTFNRRPVFDWTDIAGATSYGVYLQNTGTGSVIANISGLVASSWTPSADLPDGGYAWWAIADSSTAGIRGTWSPKTEFYVGGRTTITAPGSTASSTTPRLQWLAVDGAARYELWVNGDVEGAKLIYQTSLTANSFQVSVPFVSGRTYRMWVRAVSISGEAALWSATRVFTVAQTEIDMRQESEGELPLDVLRLSLADTQLLLQPWESVSSGTGTPRADFEVTTASSVRGSQADSAIEPVRMTGSNPQDSAAYADLLMKVFASVSGCDWLDDVPNPATEQTELAKIDNQF